MTKPGTKQKARLALSMLIKWVRNVKKKYFGMTMDVSMTTECLMCRPVFLCCVSRSFTSDIWYNKKMDDDIYCYKVWIMQNTLANVSWYVSVGEKKCIRWLVESWLDDKSDFTRHSKIRHKFHLNSIRITSIVEY